MAASNYQFRLIVRRTVIGEQIIDRLEAQGVDRTAEARRWLELGFAAEQAGFRLDGSDLRFADRSWESQPQRIESAVPVAPSSPTAPVVDRREKEAQESVEVVPGSVLAPVDFASISPAPGTAAETLPLASAPRPPPSIASSPLLGNLRGLSAS